VSSVLPPLILELRAKAGEVSSELGKVGAEVEALDKKTEASAGRGQKAFKGLASVGKAAFLGVAGGAALVGTEALKMGADYQEATTQLVTGAGESKANIAGVRKGLLDMAPAVGMGPEALAKAMFLVESAGFHGAQGLTVMKAAAEGAKIGGADATVVADGLTTALKDYNIPASQAAATTSKLVATVAAGKTNMGDLSGALAHVLPFAAGLKVSFNDVMGAMATMTGQGIDAAQAATYLKFTMMSLANETPKGKKALALIGMTAAKVGQDLSKKGLSGTLNEITDALGKKFPKGSAQYNAALANIVGGTRGMGAALALTGTHAKDLTGNIKSISGATTEAGGHVKGWATTSEDANVKMAKLKAGVQAMGIKLGTFLIPKVEAIVGWLTKHTTIVKILAGVIGGVMLLAMGAWIVSLFTAGGALAFLISPIALVVAAVALIAFGIYELVKHWSTAWAAVKAVMSSAWGVIKSVGNSIWGFLKRWGPLILTAIAPVIGIPLLIAQHWKSIVGFVHGVWDAVVDFIKAIPGRLAAFGKTLWSWMLAPLKAQWALAKAIWNGAVSFVGGIPGRVRRYASVLWSWMLAPLKAEWAGILREFNGIVSFVSGLPGRIGRVARGMWDGVKDAFRSAINWIIGAWDSLHFSIHIPSAHVGPVHIGGGTIGFGVPQIPMLAGGGILTAPTLMVGGEGHEPEVVQPLSKLKELLNDQGGDKGHGAGCVHVHLPPGAAIFDGTKLWAEVQKAALRHGGRNSQTYQAFKR
jgi:TP901 family phage tail tape measure protein